MMKFQALFGVKPAEIKKTCILLPFLPKGILADFGINKISRGRLYGVGQGTNFSLIHSGIGPVFTGDAVLYLRETIAQNLILFGSCGAIKQVSKLKIGSLVSPQKAYNFESFTGMILNIAKPACLYPDKRLFAALTKSRPFISVVSCATVGSLALEEEKAGKFINNGMDVSDMECSAFFSASFSIKRKAVALFYVSDIITRAPFYFGLGDKENNELQSSIKKSAGLLRGFISDYSD